MVHFTHRFLGGTPRSIQDRDKIAKKLKAANEELEVLRQRVQSEVQHRADAAKELEVTTEQTKCLNEQIALLRGVEQQAQEAASKIQQQQTHIDNLVKVESEMRSKVATLSSTIESSAVREAQHLKEKMQTEEAQAKALQELESQVKVAQQRAGEAQRQIIVSQQECQVAQKATEEVQQQLVDKQQRLDELACFEQKASEAERRVVELQAVVLKAED